MSINRTLVLGLDYVLVEKNRRRNLMYSQKGIALDQFSESRDTIKGGERVGNNNVYSSLDFTNIKTVFSVVGNYPFRVTLTNTSGTFSIDVSDVFLVTGEFSSVTVTNRNMNQILTISTIKG